jgi:hypothetical protein
MGPIIEQVSEGILEIYFPEPLSGIDLIQLKKELYEEINIPSYTVIQLDLSNCGGVLYKDGDYFGCRHCYELTYSSRNKNRNHYLNSLFRVLEIEMEEEKLYKKAKRFTYKGKPTKIRQKIEKLDGEMFRSYRQYTQLEKGVRLGTKGRKK